MSYAVKALAACRAPVRLNKDVDWAANEIREVDDELIERFRANPAGFTILSSGPGQVAVTNALLAVAGTALGPYATSAALQAAYPAASNTGKHASVGELCT